MYLYCRTEYPHLGSLSTCAHTLRPMLLVTNKYTVYLAVSPPLFMRFALAERSSNLLVTNKYTIYLAVSPPLFMWFALAERSSNLTSLVNLYFSFRIQYECHFPWETFSDLCKQVCVHVHHKPILGHSGFCKEHLVLSTIIA